MGMTQLQQDVLAHLTMDSGGHRERIIALNDLTDEGFFTEEEPEDKTVLLDYIRENRHDFCQDGIQRLLDAVGVENPTPVILATMVVTVQLDGSWTDFTDDPENCDIENVVEELLVDPEQGVVGARVSNVPLFAPTAGKPSQPDTIHFDVLAPITAHDKEAGYIDARQTTLPKLAAVAKQQGTPAGFPKK